MRDYWRWTALITYLVICIYDFMVVPIWYGLSRAMLLDVDSYMTNLQLIDDPMVQMEYMKKLVSQHEPFTLQGGGLFHLAFGALLTGSTLRNKK
ncbi:hypothetical protein CMI47_14785 [Candidatus Pacearchaeota archaeon]|nr:hypothetical protein [Candidatus Pacearchaeota archaeon]